MPAAKTNRGRLAQVERWLRAAFPLDKPVSVQVLEDLGDDGEAFADCDLVKGRFEIRLHADLLCESTPYHAIEKLMHEWAHARAWFHPTKEHHPDIWGVHYARIYRAYVDEGGYEKSLRISPHPWR